MFAASARNVFLGILGWMAVVSISTLYADRPFPATMIAESEAFRVLATPQFAPDGLLATVISIETLNVTDRIVTLDNVVIAGDVHQIWTDIIGMPTTNPDRLEVGPIFHEDWVAADTHLLIEPSMVGGGAGSGFFVSEFNDGSDPKELAEELPLTIAGLGPLIGVGDLRSAHPTDAFFFDTLFQSNAVDFAYVVTPFDGELGDVRISLGIQGGDDSNLPIGPVDFTDIRLSSRSFIPPCDFNFDGECELTDIDALLRAVGTNDQQFNILQSPLPIDLGDVERWLEMTGLALVGESYVGGDTDLDGDVDATDLNRVALNWQIDDAISWAQGDFNADHQVDAADLNILGIHWLRGSRPPDVIGVPEPANSGFMLLALLVFGRIRVDSRIPRDGGEQK